MIAGRLPASVAAYTEYDVLLVNAVMDGLNLVAKEAPLVNARGGVARPLCARPARSRRSASGRSASTRSTFPARPTPSRGRSPCRPTSGAGGWPRSGHRFAPTTSTRGPSASSPSSSGVLRRRSPEPRRGYDAAVMRRSSSFLATEAHAERALASSTRHRGRPHGRRRREAASRAAARSRAAGCGWRQTTASTARASLPKGDALTVARIAGIQAAKRTSDLDPALPPAAAHGRRGRPARSTTTAS